jgi:hypothetical protein
MNRLAFCFVIVFPLLVMSAAAWSETEVSWEKVACPFDSSKALLPVTCGRLKVTDVARKLF